MKKRVAIGTGGVLLAGGLGACGGSSGSASGTLSAFLSAWDRGDGAAAAKLVDHPPAGFAAALGRYTADLHAASVTRHAGPVTSAGGRRTATVTSTYQLPGAGPWTVGTTVALRSSGGHWKVVWAPSVVAPGLVAGQRLAATYGWAPRAAILGAGGVPLTTEADQIVVGVEGSRVKDPAALSKLLETSGAPAPAVTSALAAAAAHPTFFEPVFTLSAAAYAALGGNGGALHAAPGTVFKHVTARTAVTPGLAAHLVGSVGPVTAEQLKQLGPPYTAASVVGQSGLEAADQKQLAGTPGATIEVLGADGGAVRTLATLAPKPGRPVTTTIDPAVQKAAEAALATLGAAQVAPPSPGAQPAGDAVALVAVSVDKDQVLASASLPAQNSFDAALDGEFPPGSTFKILTSTALFQAGLSPSTPASCPSTVTVDGKVFHNAEGDHPVSDLAQAFTESCNTAFIQLATGHLQPGGFPAVARMFGLGQPFHMGLAAFPGKVPTPAAGADLAATSIGQGSVVVSPLSMAMVAAAVGSGTARPPRLVAGAADDTAPGQALPPTALTALRAMMASVVSSGTAAGTGLPSGTFAKTGTAEYGSGPKPPVDAWLVGFRANVAFAMVVQNSRTDGGPTDGPVVARFLAGLPATAG
ncbi:MAG TPA: penicillin-binding transpeptidase domain-containing protein [Acidimicrobiales bacterium]|nr:penicillin-binding transpeptidase domain-containing protein [Acidimicrobiales bacterium]